MTVGFLVLNMIVGIVVVNYQMCQEKQELVERKSPTKTTKDSLEITDKTGKKTTILLFFHMKLFCVMLAQNNSSSSSFLNFLKYAIKKCINFITLTLL